MQNMQVRKNNAIQKAKAVALITLTILLSACSPSPAISDASLRCPALPADLSVEARRKPVIEGDTAVEVAGRLVTQVHRKNSALRRAIAAHEDCRK